MQLESTPRFTEQLEHVGNLKILIHITGLLKGQSELCVTNIAELSCHPQQRRQLLCWKEVDHNTKLFGRKSEEIFTDFTFKRCGEYRRSCRSSKNTNREKFWRVTQGLG